MWNLYRYLRFLNLLFSRIPVPLCLFITPNSTVLLDRYILVYTLHIVQRSKQRDSGKANSILTSYFKLFNSKAGHDQIFRVYQKRVIRQSPLLQGKIDPAGLLITRAGHATTMPRQRGHVDCCHMTIFALATPLRHRGLTLFHFFSGP